MMGLSGIPALDVAIGLALVFFLLSTVCAAINEWVASLLGWRAKTLEDAIHNLLEDPAVRRGWKEWVGRVSKHEPKGGDSAEHGTDGVRLPADLTSAVFDHWRIRALTRDPDSDVRRRSRPSYLPPRAFSLAVAETLAAGAPDAPEGPSRWLQADEEILARAARVLESVPEGRPRRLLAKALANAGGTLEGFRAQVEYAFDDGMERASGWYKRKVQIVVIVLAAVVAIGLNVDTLGVAKRLWNEAPVRAAVTAKASDTSGPQGAADSVDAVRQLQLPVGWGSDTAPSDVGGVLRRVPGWLITIAGLSLGAPFWFDLLSRFARLRAAGVPEKPRSLSDTPGTRRTERAPPPSAAAKG
jgi:hypothetical protein